MNLDRLQIWLDKDTRPGDDNIRWQGTSEEECKEMQIDNIETTLTDRGNRYGEFKGHADITQRIKNAMYYGQQSNERLTDVHREALDMIAHKIGRILNGDPNYADSWHDIAGYATLAEKECKNG